MIECKYTDVSTPSIVIPTKVEGSLCILILIPKQPTNSDIMSNKS